MSEKSERKSTATSDTGWQIVNAFIREISCLTSCSSSPIITRFHLDEENTSSSRFPLSLGEGIPELFLLQQEEEDEEEEKEEGKGLSAGMNVCKVAAGAVVLGRYWDWGLQ